MNGNALFQRGWAALLAVLALVASNAAQAQGVPIKALGRFDGWRDNALIGYGIVTGLSGSGDTRRNEITRQALRSVLSRLGTAVSDDQINSRNVAVVIVTATLPASANPGDRIDAVVSSVGDARSLAGGTLLMTPLIGPDQHPYALAQGSLTVGGYDFEANLNRQQRNYPTSAVLPGGATVENAVDASILKGDGHLSFLLTEPSFTTAQRIADAINSTLGFGIAEVRNADEVRIRFGKPHDQLAAFVSEIENVGVEPAASSRIVINERTGTVVAGADVRISSAVISQGDLKVTVTSENYASQPSFIGGFASDVSSLIVTNTKLEVDQGGQDAVLTFPNTSVGALVQGLSKARVDTRRTISILQALKDAGALHAEILVQ
ncbi:flagellar biosynthesis protein FlgA [Croceicoccus estronivorus]|uniref:flagellar basal body P-ring protein FlgI n=1 Tax=Croceicoccus estronivorus TaxID=1172626 RepID=UPI000834E0CD|nr:flagellar basal body P-ring protein FlgI [Croceicoccus estronivorus]OCC22941.1 flagellar biosynthesis protein FlgA [Croceicoccus estronivorus]